MIRRLVIATIALSAGIGVAAGLLIYDRAGQSSEEVYAATTDLPAGALLGGGAIRLVRAGLEGRQAALAYRAGEKTRLAATEAAHDLTAGQIIQRSDTVLAGHDGPRALVVVALKDAPPLRAGDRVDLLAVTGSGDSVSVSLFAPAVEVHAVTGGGAVLEVGADQAAGFVYASAALRLVAVQLPHGPISVGNGPDGSRAPDEAPIVSSQQARAVARR